MFDVYSNEFASNKSKSMFNFSQLFFKIFFFQEVNLNYEPRWMCVCIRIGCSSHLTKEKNMQLDFLFTIVSNNNDPFQFEWLFLDFPPNRYTFCAHSLSSFHSPSEKKNPPVDSLKQSILLSEKTIARREKESNKLLDDCQLTEKHQVLAMSQYIFALAFLVLCSIWPVYEAKASRVDHSYLPSTYWIAHTNSRAEKMKPTTYQSGKKMHLSVFHSIYFTCSREPCTKNN